MSVYYQYIMTKFSKLFVFLLISFVATTSIAQQTERIYLSGTDSKNTVEWDFFCTEGQNSGSWTKIAVPSNWELQGFGNYNYGNDWRANGEPIKIGEEHGLYKHKFDIPKDWKGKRIKIVFDGSMTDTEVRINGKPAGEIHQGGFNRFTYDISNLLIYGRPNLLEVDVAKRSANESVNKAEREADFWIFGGIYRPVFLEVNPSEYLARVAIDAKANGSFYVLSVLNNTKIAGEIKVELSNVDGTPIDGDFRSEIKKGKDQVGISGKFEGIKSWNPEMPVLYDMKVSLLKNGNLIHEEIKRIGFRTVELREHDGFYINDKKVIFKGVNRHSFWPETGRALNDDNHKLDISLMKEMNMNAVRMSHYAPDERFLELCDSLGLFVLDELTGWQDGYDTTIGPKRIKELILKDENHPSVVIWDHGNEGGHDLANEKWFYHYDIQKRPVIYPWLNKNGVDTHHYISYDFGINRFAFGNDVFMPTEFLHGLYDGGHGAGLHDIWNQFLTNPRAAGGFLWVFADEAVLRTDKKGIVYDANGNQGPDGILGPHREKEGSFYTIKELWSPVQVEPVVISPNWNGKLLIRNSYIYTNLDKVSFTWKAIRTPLPNEGQTVILASGSFDGPSAEPGETRSITIELNDDFNRSDLFSLTATDQYRKEIYTWTWQIQDPKIIVERYLDEIIVNETDKIIIKESEMVLKATINDLEFTFDLRNARLLKILNAKGEISFTGGPKPVSVESQIKEVKWFIDKEQNLILEAKSDKYPEYFYWKLHHDTGLLELEVAYNLSARGIKNIDFLGVSFNYPEEKVRSMQWFGNGPYRVWKNRIHGTNMGLWEKEYNNTITGESFDNMIYPEFKGYHANMNWVRFETTETPFTILAETPNLFMQIFTPEVPKEVKGDVMPVFPDGDISFLYEIPAMGTKFRNAVELGPSGQKGKDRLHWDDEGSPIHVWFDFRY